MQQLEVNKEKYTKGNILIKKDLLNKYDSVKEIFEKENVYKRKIIINTELSEIDLLNIESLKIEEVKILANKIFESYHKNKIFVNDSNEIVVSKTGIFESIEKIYNNYNQREL